MLFRRLLPLLAVAAALLPAAPAPADAAPRTRTAAAYAEAALRAEVAVRARVDEHRQRVRDLRVELCLRAVRAVPARQPRRARRAIAVFVAAVLQPFVDVFVPVGQQLVADLYAVPTRDRALIAGRIAWRRSIAELERFPAVDRPCERLDDWRASGWDPAKAPPDPTAALRALEEDPDENELGIRIAARRLRRLGVSPAAARRFTGARFLDALTPRRMPGGG